MQAFAMHPTARLHNREKCITFGGYHDGDFYPSEDNFFLTRLIHHGYKIYNYQAKPLHIRGYENNYGHSPKVHLQWGVNDSRIIFTLAGKGKFALDRFIEYLSYKAKDLKNINCHYMALYLDMILLYLNNPKGFKDFQIQDEFSESLILKNLLKDPFDIYNLK